MGTSNQVLSSFARFCREYQVHFQQIDEGVFMSSVRTNHCQMEVRCYVGDTYLLFYSLLPVIVPPAKQQAVMEFITLANCGRVIGSLEMNLKNGDVGYKTSILNIDGQLTSATLHALLGGNIGAANHYLQGLCQVTFADMQPSIALQQLENSEQENAEDDRALRELLNDPAIDEALGKIDE